MKWKIIITLITFATNVLGQELPTNPQTGLVSISDSIQLKDKSLPEVKDALQKWGNSLMDGDNLKRVFKLNNSNQMEIVTVGLPVGSILTIENGKNKFLINGTLIYSKGKSTAFTSTYTQGGIKFNFSYTITTQKLIYEFSNLEYSPDFAHYGKSEDETPPKDNLNRSLILKMGKKEWRNVREEYFNNLKVLCENLKEYVTNLLLSNLNSTIQSPVNYESYKKIKIGMTYDEVINIFGDEGKELTNSSSQVNGITVIRQNIIWYDLDKSKNITISFTDGKVSSKSQSNL